MGYDFAVRGFFSAPASEGHFAAAVEETMVEHAREWAHPSSFPQWVGEKWYQHDYAVTGKARNQLVFGTVSKHSSHAYLMMLRSLAARFADGVGMVLITGEIPEGRDHMVGVRGGRLRRLPLDRLYVPPWRELVNACHHVDWATPLGTEATVAACNEFPGNLRQLDEIWGFLGCDWEGDRYERLYQDMLERFPAMRLSTALMNQYGEPHILLAEDGCDGQALTEGFVWASTQSASTAGILLGRRCGEVRPYLIQRGQMQALEAVPWCAEEWPEWNTKTFTGLQEPPDAWL